jgi:hypothetical protein
MWAKVGVVPLTRACLSNKQVQRVLLGEQSKQAAVEADKLGDAADASVDLLAESAKAADASVDLLAESELCEPLDSEEEANYSLSTYWSGSNSTDRGSNSTESGSNTTESSIATPRANQGERVGRQGTGQTRSERQTVLDGGGVRA